MEYGSDMYLKSGKRHCKMPYKKLYPFSKKYSGFPNIKKKKEKFTRVFTDLPGSGMEVRNTQKKGKFGIIIIKVEKK